MTLAPVVLTALASFAGGPVDIECLPRLQGDVQGRAFFVGRIELESKLCRKLNYLYRHKRIAPREMSDGIENATAAGVLTALHEAAHIRGGPAASEAEVSCAARRNVAALAKRLGAPRAVRVRLVRFARESQSLLPLRYQSPC